MGDVQMVGGWSEVGAEEPVASPRWEVLLANGTVIEDVSDIYGWGADGGSLSVWTGGRRRFRAATGAKVEELCPPDLVLSPHAWLSYRPVR